MSAPASAQIDRAMNHCFLPRRFLFVFFVAVAALAANGADKRNITEKDLFDFVWIGDTQVSPDGARVAFTVWSYDATFWSFKAR